LRNNASRWFLLQEYITMHGPLNVKFTNDATQYIPPKTLYSSGNRNRRRPIIDFQVCGTLNIILVTVFVVGGKINYLTLKTLN